MTSWLSTRFGVGIAALILLLGLGMPVFDASAAPVSPRDVAVGSLTVGTSPQDIVIDPTGTFGYAPICDSRGSGPGRVVKVRLSDFSIDDSVSLAPSSCAMSVAVSGGYVYVTTMDKLYRLSASSLSTTPSSSVAIAAYGSGIAISGPYAYITHSVSNTITRVSLATFADSSDDSQISTGVGQYPMGISIDGSGDFAYVVDTISSHLQRIRLSDFTITGTLLIGQQPYGIDVDDTYAYVPLAAAESWGVYTPPWLMRINLDTFALDDTVLLPFTWGFSVDVDDSGSTAYVTQSRGSGLVAKVALGAQMSIDGPVIQVGDGPQAVAISPTQPFFVTANANDGWGSTLSKVAIGPTPPTPTLASVTPSSGSSAGGNIVTITGIHLLGATSVSFGASAATILSGTDDTVAVTVPAGSAGAQQVTVTTPGGTSSQNVSYTYIAGPVLTGMTPSSGPVTGGTTITISGSGLTGATVDFDGTAVTTSTNDDTTITIVTPPSAAGTRTVTVTTSGGGAIAGSFTYVDSPVVGPWAPSAPISPTAVPGDGEVHLTWRPPALDGGAAISSYSVEQSVNGGAWTVAVASTGDGRTSRAMGGLVNGTSYRFRVSAINSVGAGGASTPSPAVIPAAQPSAPTMGEVAVVRDGVSVRWTAPLDDGGSPITSYAIQSAANGTDTWVSVVSSTGSTATSRTLIGLPPGRNYRFRVAAINSATRGAFSAASPSVTLAGVPGAPRISEAVGGDGMVNLKWDRPVDDGGRPITGYRIERSRDRGATWVAISSSTRATHAVVTGLTNGQNYVFKVAAINSVGVGRRSKASSPVTPGASITPSASWSPGPL